MKYMLYDIGCAKNVSGFSDFLMDALLLNDISSLNPHFDFSLFQEASDYHDPQVSVETPGV